MATTLLIQEQLEIPFAVSSLAEFRGWVHSAEFPEHGRIDFIRNRIEIDMAAEELFTHGTPKAEIAATLHQLAKRKNIGRVFIDRTRVSNIGAELSAEPDVVFVSRDGLATGRVQLVPKVSGERGRYIELEGSPDLIVEVVSDTSEKKDTERLPASCYDAGVREYWLVDARNAERLTFEIHQRGERQFEPQHPDEEGYQRSIVFDCRFRLDRTVGDDGHWEFDLRSKEIT